MEGFRFFMFSIFLTSFLFFLIVKKSKSILWFSAFAFFQSLILFAPTILAIDNSDFFLYCCLLVFGLMIYSLIAFIFHTFYEKLPARINWYFIILLSVGLILFFQLAYPNSYFRFFEPFNKFFKFLGLGIYMVILIESFVKIIYALILKKRKIKIIALGLILYLASAIALGFDFGSQKLLMFTVYIIPVSFLITLIYLIKDSFTENITKKEEILQLTLANESILKEQNIILDKKVIERTTEVVEQKKKLEEQKQEITDSIQYAQRIQFAILPTKENIVKAFPQSFILFKPKDIVSGDFYWFQEVEGKKYIAACDCTGHGVPGALMSMVATDMLNDALVHTKKVDEILAHTNRSIKTALKQSTDDDSTRDGMDIALCCFNDKTNVLQFAGAYRPLWLIRFSHAEQSEASKNAYELLEFKATKAAIGGLTEDNQTFQLNEIQLQKGDTIYLASDGFADQFSPADKKLMTKRFKEILLSIQHLSMPEQGKVFR
jgi:serine phosphatase RsbU (regulator of sigma subunit)